MSQSFQTQPFGLSKYVIGQFYCKRFSPILFLSYHFNIDLPSEQYLRTASVLKPVLELVCDGVIQDEVDKVSMDDDVFHPLEDLEPIGRGRLAVAVPDGPDHLGEVKVDDEDFQTRQCNSKE